MKNFFKTAFFKIILAICVVFFGVFLYTATVKGSNAPTTSLVGIIVTPIQNTGIYIKNLFASVYQKSFEFEDLVAENSDLKNEVRVLEAKLREVDNITSENESLKQMLKISNNSPNFEMEIAEVVGNNFTNTNSVIILDRGSNVGIELNDLVITEDGLVGYIISVGLNYSKVLTVLDPNLNIGAIVSRSREIGIVEGSIEDYEEGCSKLRYLSKNSDVNVGDLVETSGISGIYPKGILIGKVKDLSYESSGVSKFAKIEPSVDIKGLKRVYVVKNF